MVYDGGGVFSEVDHLPFELLTKLDQLTVSKLQVSASLHLHILLPLHAKYVLWRLSHVPVSRSLIFFAPLLPISAETTSGPDPGFLPESNSACATPPSS